MICSWDRRNYDLIILYTPDTISQTSNCICRKNSYSATKYGFLQMHSKIWPNTTNSHIVITSLAVQNASKTVQRPGLPGPAEEVYSTPQTHCQSLARFFGRNCCSQRLEREQEMGRRRG